MSRLCAPALNASPCWALSEEVAAQRRVRDRQKSSSWSKNVQRKSRGIHGQERQRNSLSGGSRTAPTQTRLQGDSPLKLQKVHINSHAARLIGAAWLRGLGRRLVATGWIFDHDLSN